MDAFWIIGCLIGALTQTEVRALSSRLPRYGSGVGDVGRRQDDELTTRIDAVLGSLVASKELTRSRAPTADADDTDVIAAARLKDISNVVRELSDRGRPPPSDASTKAVALLGHVAYMGYLIGFDMRLGESRRLVFPTLTIYVSKFEPAHFGGLYFSTDDGAAAVAIPPALALPPGVASAVAVSYSISGGARAFDAASNATLAGDVVVGATFFDADGAELSLAFDDEPVLIVVRLSSVPEGKRPRCAFIRRSEWSTEGCDTAYPTVHDVNTVECRCNHLTMFGVILIDQGYVPRIGVAAMIGSGLTVLFCLITALVFIGFRLMHSIRCYIRFSFLTALALAEIMYLCIRYTEAPAMCTMVAAGSHMFALASFTWLLSYALFLGNDMIGDNDTSLHVTHYTFLGWAVPLAVVLISFIWRYDSYVHDRYCWISDKHGLAYAFVLPVCFMILSTLCVLLYDIAVYSSGKIRTKSTMLKISRSGLRSCCCLLPVLSSVWLLAHFMINIGYLSLQIVFSVLNALLGVMLFLIMFWFNEEVTMRLNHKNLRTISFWPKSPRLLRSVRVKERVAEITLGGRRVSPRPGTSSDGRTTYRQGTPYDTQETELGGPGVEEPTAQDSPYLKLLRPAPIASSEDSLLTKESDEAEAYRADVVTEPSDSSTVKLLQKAES